MIGVIRFITGAQEVDGGGESSKSFRVSPEAQFSQRIAASVGLRVSVRERTTTRLNYNNSFAVLLTGRSAEKQIDPRFKQIKLIISSPQTPTTEDEALLSSPLLDIKGRLDDRYQEELFIQQ